MAVRDNPALFSGLDSARRYIRAIRGASGKDVSSLTPQFQRTKGVSGDPFGQLPEGLTFYDDWKALEIAGPLRALVVNDLHIPYHDTTAVRLALRAGLDHRANLVLLNGDIADFFACSFWEKDPSKRNFAEELKTVKEFLGLVRKGFPKARIIFKLGNHEDRYIRYMRVKAPELLGVADFELGALLGLAGLGIELVGENRPVRLGELNVLHGHEYKFAISNPVNPARGLFLRAKAYAMCGHLHQPSYHSEKTLEQKTLATWSVGCLCDLHPDYSPINNWSHGFALVDVDGKGKFNVRNPIIRSGKIY